MAVNHFKDVKIAGPDGVPALSIKATIQRSI